MLGFWAMWCSQCQQDVPVQRGGAGAAACPRCRAPLGRPADFGVALDSFDCRPVPRPPDQVRRELDETAAALRRIGRRLGAPIGEAVGLDGAAASAALPAIPPRLAESIRRVDSGEGPAVAGASDSRTAGTPSADAAHPHRRCRRPGLSGASLATDAGLVAVIAGAATLAAVSEGLVSTGAWTWGVAEAALGAGLFALGLQRLATVASQRCGALEREVDALRTAIRGPAR
ncbi:MAG TPA: hypothetical protein VEQ85_14350 [Lacipirellulaceae bacterium]|nr:hypothetical protein [Lacipirellulaceae bacterium]